jgi:DNA-binding transcriptional LysR family regulator
MRYIHESNLKHLDFRLLELFQAIRQSKSVTAAALILEIPQPTATRWLNRLRETINDELFVRSAHGMEPTTRAMEVSEIIEEILRLGNELETRSIPFDPAIADREFIIAGSDVGQWVVLAPLYRAAASYPGIRFKTVAAPRSDLSYVLESGDVDLAFGPYPGLLGGIKEQTLYGEEYRCFYRPDHRLVADPSIQTFIDSDHLIATGRVFGHAHRETETKLARLLPPHRIRASAENYIVALASLIETDLVFTCPAVGIGPVAQRLGLAAVKPPLELPTFDIKQYWHCRHDDDVAHRWLRSQIHDTLRGRAITIDL